MNPEAKISVFEVNAHDFYCYRNENMFFLEYAHASYLCEMSADPPDEYVSPWHLLMFKLEIDLAAQIGHCQLRKNPVIANKRFIKQTFFRPLKQWGFF